MARVLWSEIASSYARAALAHSALPLYSGDVVHVEVLGQHIIILGSHEACEELLVKRGATYSDRPVFTMANL